MVLVLVPGVEDYMVTVAEVAAEAEMVAAVVGMIVVASKLAADGVGKVTLFVGADATVVVHKEDDLVQKNASVEELRKPMEEEKADALEVQRRKRKPT
ncbi:hypothetical protein B296_00001248 [Ensete ventricosum]|uniref:Uncharacterized protein n=1 Tax=Ensete ventricosum TaxID=4639 RepID=A0A427B1B6_ENSVE|nr:hypothetical protein B296_00001248 [Ensete ventricosum]